MARIRSIKPDAFRSDSLSQVPRGVRWTFAGLWTYFDDKGRGRDNLRLIKAELYPLDDDVTVDVLADDLRQLASLGAICRYNVDGREYLHAPKWKHQTINRPKDSQIPPCPHHDTPMSDHGSSSDASVNDHDLFTDETVQEKEQGTGKGRDAQPAGFAEFWMAYPRRVGKGHAVKAWNAAVKRGVDPPGVIAAAASFAATCNGTDPKYIPHPATWLNGERYDDEHESNGVNGKPRRVFTPPPPPDDLDVNDTAAYQAWWDAERRKAEA